MAYSKVLLQGLSNPVSGSYVGRDENFDLELKIDIDKTTQFAEVLDIISGTVTRRTKRPQSNRKRLTSITLKLFTDHQLSDKRVQKKWKALYFSSKFQLLEISKRNARRVISLKLAGNIKCWFDNESSSNAELILLLTADEGTSNWKGNLNLKVPDGDDPIFLAFSEVKREGIYFRNISLNICYMSELVLPVVRSDDFSDSAPGAEDHELNVITAFEKAGVKFEFNEIAEMQSNKWTFQDFKKWMKSQGRKIEPQRNTETVWCLLGDYLDDRRLIGYSVDLDGIKGFGLFLKQSFFSGLKSNKKKEKAEAHRELLHLFVHYIGKASGLRNSSYTKNLNSPSWMTHTWRHDAIKSPDDNFYRNFDNSFTMDELVVLRHSPRETLPRTFINRLLFAGYHAPSDFASNQKSYQGYVYGPNSQVDDDAMREISVDLNLRKDYQQGDHLDFAVRVKNVGKLPVLIDMDLSPESGNLMVHIKKPGGYFEVVHPYSENIYSGNKRPLVLKTSTDEPGSDRHSETMILQHNYGGNPIEKPGQYEIRVLYVGGRFEVMSRTYSFSVMKSNVAPSLNAEPDADFPYATKFWKDVTKGSIDAKKFTQTNALAKRIHEAISDDKSNVDVEGLLTSTYGLMAHLSKNGQKANNMEYANLALARSKLLAMNGAKDEAKAEFDKVTVKLGKRGVKLGTLKTLTKQFEKTVYGDDFESKRTPEHLQQKVEKYMKWIPKLPVTGRSDLSGLGLRSAFSDFDQNQKAKAFKVVKMLFARQKSTRDVLDTIKFGNKLQKSYEVNDHALKYALEVFMVHSPEARKSGLKLPEPEELNEVESKDAMKSAIVRKTQKSEDWMNYWRSDSDLNYHHRHWHIVYSIDQHTPARAQNDLKRRGEMFGYMHSQMLARYNADRESWGLSPVTAWKLHEKALPFSAGIAFDTNPVNELYVPRPAGRWPYKSSDKMKGIHDFEDKEKKFKYTVKNGLLQVKNKRIIDIRLNFDPNVAGWLLESSSPNFVGIDGDKDPDHGYHNNGHITFGYSNLPPNTKDGKMSYMGDTKTAARDFIFYRWHKRVDYFWQLNNERFNSEIASDRPPVIIGAGDIMISPHENPPDGFYNGEWQEEKMVVKTIIGPPRKRFERDGKLDHEKFFFHIRVRKEDNAKGEDIKLTIRIFICPKKRRADRRCWIEMDKFVAKMPPDTDHTVLTRADKQSSVIRKSPNSIHGKEGPLQWCECGWPYSMLLPRGRKDGEEYLLFVMATNNDFDRVGFDNSCGSLSYCGARGILYPDKRYMGYPFSTPISIDGHRTQKQIPEVFDDIDNAAYREFIIENNLADPPQPSNVIFLWNAWTQLGDNDGNENYKNKNAPPEDKNVPPETNYMAGDKVGSFRVNVSGEHLLKEFNGKMMVRFQGRGSGNGSYTIRNVTLSQERGKKVNITAKGKTKFEVPEFGLISDPFEYNLKKVQHFITFAVDGPSVELIPTNETYMTGSLWFPPSVKAEKLDDLSPVVQEGIYLPEIYCVSGIVVNIDEVPFKQ